MRFRVSFVASFVALIGLAFAGGASAQTQNSTAQAGPNPTTTTNGTYIAVDPLAKVTYDNRWDISLGFAYDHMKAGPTLLQGSNLGGLDLAGSYWLSKHWGVEGNVRAYAGTSGAGINSADTNGGNIKGPFVAEYMLLAGPEWLGPHNKHGALIAHFLAGGTYGDFGRDLGHVTPIDPNPFQAVDFYNTQIAPVAAIGGHLDLNRSPRWVFRVTADAVMTHYSINYPPKTAQFDVNYAMSVGIQYKFKKKR
jgi:hypothetical protein